MGELRFYGASDDLVEVEGVFSDEYGTTDRSFLVVTPDSRQAYVRVKYERSGVWAIVFRPVDEDVPCPTGTIGATEKGYSAFLTLDVPEGTLVHTLDDPDA